MCAGSEAKIRDKDVDVYMGYYGGEITIDGKKYSQRKDEGNMSKSEMVKYLSEYNKEELALLIVDLIQNSEE